MPTTTKGFPYPAPDAAVNVPADMQALAASLNTKVPIYDSGPVSTRPVSTGGSPGIAGRRFYATDELIEYIDSGTSWLVVGNRPDGAVDLADLSAALKPSGTAADTDEALRKLGLTTGRAYPGAYMMRGTLAARPAFGSEGRLYEVTTGTSAGCVFKDTGAAWVIVGKRPDGDIVDTELASPNNAAYKNLLTSGAMIAQSQAAGTYLLVQAFSFSAGGVGGELDKPRLVATTADIVSDYSTGGRAVTAPAFIFFDDADALVAGKTQKLRLRAQVNNNGTAWSSVTATFGLYPVNFSGGTGTLVCTLGTVVSGSTVALPNPPANGTNHSNSGDFTIPADGQYCIGVVLSAALTANAASLLTAQLQTRHV